MCNNVIISLQDFSLQDTWQFRVTGFQAIRRLVLENSGDMRSTTNTRQMAFSLFSRKGVACERRIKVSNGVFEDLILADAWCRKGEHIFEC